MKPNVRSRSALAIAALVVVLFTGGAWIYNSRQPATTDVTALTQDTSQDTPANTENPTQTVEFAAGEPPATEVSITEEPQPIAEPTPPLPTPPTELVVHVSGEVKKPGIYKVPPGARIYEAIEMAGGFTEKAQQDALNLADRVRDADQLNIPARPTKTALPPPQRPAIVRGSTEPVSATPSRSLVAESRTSQEPTTAEPSTGRVLGKEPPAIASGESGSAFGDRSGGSTAGSSGTSGESKGSSKLRVPGEGTVNINTADGTELQRLPGVGPALSQRILDYRQQIGRFSDASQLQDVKGIGPKTFAKMQPFVRVD
jgi:competence protein ComEA